MPGTRNYLKLLLFWTLATVYTEPLPFPVVQLEPEQTVYIVGESLTVRCVAANPSTITRYVFYKDSAVILNITSANILTKVLSTSDSGRYFCIYYNQYEEKSPESGIINLRVLEPPPSPSLFITPQRNVFIKDQPAVLRCDLPKAQQQSPTVTGITLYQDGRETLESDNFGVLNYTKLQIQNAGNYSCRYTVILSGRTILSYYSKEVALIVIEPLPFPVVQLEPEQTVYIVGESLTARCVAENPSTITRYVFYKDSAVILNITSANILTKDHLTTSDSGSYFCIYYNQYKEKSPESVIINLRVLEQPPSPSLFITPQRNVFTKDQPAVLRCDLPKARQQIPTVTRITLYQDGRETRESDNFGVLKYTKLQIQNTGNYSCRYTVILSGRTIVSYYSKEVALIVIEQPPIPRLLYSYNHQYQQVELACEVQNSPFPPILGYRFYRNGIEIKSSQGVNPAIFNYTLVFDGCFSCQTFVTKLGEEVLSPRSIEQFLSEEGRDQTQCQENTYPDIHILSEQGLKFYGSILAGKLLVLISVLVIFGVYLLVLKYRNHKPEEEIQ